MDTAASAKSARGVRMEAIVAEHETALLRYATRILGDPMAAEDVVQNVFTKLFESWQEGTHPTDKLKGWLFRVTHNEAVDHVRRESRLQVVHEQQAEESRQAECTNGAHGEGSNEERRQRVLACLQKLHPRERQVVLLRMDQNLSYEEISTITGRTVSNVGTILYHAVRKLSQRVKRNLEREP